MSMPAVALYRDFDLPWTPSLEDERRLRRVLGAVLGLFVAFGIVIPLLPETPRVAAPPAAPQRVAEFLLTPAQPKPEPRAEPRPEPVAERPAPIERPKVEIPITRPTPRTEPPPKVDPKQRAAKSGLLVMSQQLTELRQLDVATRTDAQALDAGAGEKKARVDRALLTARVGEGSGGIAVAATSSGYGGGSTGLKGHDTVKVAAPPSAVPPAGDVERSGQSRKGARTREEVELVFDRNKSAIHALYSRALRDNPALQGKVVLEVTIAPSGEVTACRIVSSELNDADLERKLVARVRMFRFDERDVATMTTTKPIEFFPA